MLGCGSSTLEVCTPFIVVLVYVIAEDAFLIEFIYVQLWCLPEVTLMHSQHLTRSQFWAVVLNKGIAFFYGIYTHMVVV